MAKLLNMRCHECDRLSAEHERLLLSNAMAFRAFRAGTAQPTAVTEYRKLSGAVNEAFIDMEIARTELEQHQRWHGGLIVPK